MLTEPFTVQIVRVVNLYFKGTLCLLQNASCWLSGHRFGLPKNLQKAQSNPIESHLAEYENGSLTMRSPSLVYHTNGRSDGQESTREIKRREERLKQQPDNSQATSQGRPVLELVGATKEDCRVPAHDAR